MNSKWQKPRERGKKVSGRGHNHAKIRRMEKSEKKKSGLLTVIAFVLVGVAVATIANAFK